MGDVVFAAIAVVTNDYVISQEFEV